MPHKPSRNHALPIYRPVSGPSGRSLRMRAARSERRRSARSASSAGCATPARADSGSWVLHRESERFRHCSDQSPEGHGALAAGGTTTRGQIRARTSEPVSGSSCHRLSSTSTVRCAASGGSAVYFGSHQLRVHRATPRLVERPGSRAERTRATVAPSLSVDGGLPRGLCVARTLRPVGTRPGRAERSDDGRCSKSTATGSDRCRSRRCTSWCTPCARRSC